MEKAKISLDLMIRMMNILAIFLRMIQTRCSPTHTITAIRTGSTEGSGTAGPIGSALTGTYGQLTLAADGSYTYVANQDAADALDVGDTVSIILTTQ